MASIIDDFKRQNKRYNHKDIKLFSEDARELGTKVGNYLKKSRKAARHFKPSSGVSHSSMGKRSGGKSPRVCPYRNRPRLFYTRKSRR